MTVNKYVVESHTNTDIQIPLFSSQHNTTCTLFLDIIQYFTFSNQAFNESLDFAAVHSLMNDMNLIDSCQAHLPVQYVSNIKFIRLK